MINITVSSDFSIRARKLTTCVAIRDLLSFGAKLERWSQLENIISRTLNCDQSKQSVILRLVQSIRKNLAAFEEFDSNRFDFILEQLELMCKEPNGRRYSGKTMMIATSLYLNN